MEASKRKHVCVASASSQEEFGKQKLPEVPELRSNAVFLSRTVFC